MSMATNVVLLRKKSGKNKVELKTDISLIYYLKTNFGGKPPSVIPHKFFCVGASNHLVLRVRLGYEQHRRC
jgi:hypothetical protein